MESASVRAAHQRRRRQHNEFICRFTGNNCSRTDHQARDDQSRCIKRSFCVSQAKFVLARYADRSEWHHHSADFANITGLLASEGCTWHDMVRTSCYLRDIERDYEAFNEERTEFYREQGLDPLPASTGIQAILCRPELLIEIEAIAMFRTDDKKAGKE